VKEQKDTDLKNYKFDKTREDRGLRPPRRIFEQRSFWPQTEEKLLVPHHKLKFTGNRIGKSCPSD
jgi:hypothetical protein